MAINSLVRVDGVIRGFFSDFTVFDKIIFEVKAIANWLPEKTIVRTINYPKESCSRLGVIINFGKRKSGDKRVIF
ncbi:MAG: hypothetical protein JNM19_09510 [Chitinophagaceae bacterium]|nr:hypothetical protein [Chitinophagaceae bacterium]